MESPPDQCPGCGAADSFRSQFTTGGGWRLAYFICENCGYQHDPHVDR